MPKDHIVGGSVYRLGPVFRVKVCCLYLHSYSLSSHAYTHTHMHHTYMHTYTIMTYTCALLLVPSKWYHVVLGEAQHIDRSVYAHPQAHAHTRPLFSVPVFNDFLFFHEVVPRGAWRSAQHQEPPDASSESVLFAAEPHQVGAERNSHSEHRGRFVQFVSVFGAWSLCRLEEEEILARSLSRTYARRKSLMGCDAEQLYVARHANTERCTHIHSFTVNRLTRA